MKILGTFGIDARELRRQTERALEIRKDEVNKPSASPPQPQIGGFRLIQGTEGKKWKLNFSITETTTKEIVTGFTITFNQFRGYIPYIQNILLQAVYNKQVGEVYSREINDTHKIAISLQDTP